MKLNRFLIPLGLVLLFSCSTPRNIVYFQDKKNGDVLSVAEAQPIRLKPSDQISVVVGSRDPQVASMFNLPYYSHRIGESQSLTNAGAFTTSSMNISGYTVDSGGYIDFPFLGKVLVADLTREEAAARIKDMLIESRQIKDPVVTVEFMNLGFSVLGEVARPGRYKIDKDRFTIFDALSLAGDLTINAERENVAVVRSEGGKDVIYRMNLLRLGSLYASPAFYIQQSDVIYVTPNDKRQRESTVNGNNVRSSSFWLSAGSLATSIAVLIVGLVK